MKLHRFSAEGLRYFHEFLDSQTTETPLPWSLPDLSDSKYACTVEPEVEIESRDFKSRLELVEYLHSRFQASNFRPAANDKALWAWIACFYYEQVCPRSRSGAWSPGARQRWIPESGDWRRYYRHLFAGPWGIYRAHQDEPRRALVVLCQPPGRPGDVVEQLASRQKVVTSPALMHLATQIFVDLTTHKLRKGAGGKSSGSARRFISVLDQFDLTWDFDVIGADQMSRLLPAEFRQ